MSVAAGVMTGGASSATVRPAVGRSVRPSLARGRSAHTKATMRLTVRGKVVFTGLAAAVLLAVSLGAWSGSVAQSAPVSEPVTSYVVRPGDTLWSYAEQITKPGEDVRSTVQELMQLNDLSSASLSVGQRIIVPVDPQ